MLLRDLFEGIGDGNRGMMTSLRQQIIDYLIPMVAHGVDFVSINDIETMLKSARTGLTIDRGLVMQLLDPTKVKLVKKVEGDKVYLSVAAAMSSNSTDDEQEKAAEKLSTKATKQAVKHIKDK